VTGVAWPGSAGPYVAGNGDHLVVFALRDVKPAGDVGGLGNAATATTVALEVTGLSLPVDFGAVDQQIAGAPTRRPTAAPSR